MTENSDNSTAKGNQKIIAEKRKEKMTKKDKCKPLTKVIIRKLPPTMTEEVFLKQIEPLPEHESYYFVPADWSLGLDSTSRAYINFINQDDIYLFKDRFDGYVFVDNKGAEYPAIVEFAPFQGLPRKCKKKDLKPNTIETDPHYIHFLEKVSKENNESKSESKLEFSFQIKSDKKITSTPLLQYLASRKQEKRDERKRRTDQKKRQRDEERRKKRVQVAKTIPPPIKEEEFKGNSRKDRDREKTYERRDREISEDIKRDNRTKRRSERDQKRRQERESSFSRTNEKRLQDNKKYDQKKEVVLKGHDNRIKEIQKHNDDGAKVSQQSHNEVSESKSEKVKLEETKGNNANSRNKSNKSSVSEEINDSVREFFMNAAGLAPLKNEASISKQDARMASDHNEKSKMLRKSHEARAVDDEKQSDNRGVYEEGRKEEKSSRRIRNKDRPSIEIYQPGKMRLSSRRDENRTNYTDTKENKSNVAFDNQNNKKENDDDQTVIKRKVSRYSERRSNRAKERGQKFDGSKFDDDTGNEEVVKLNSDAKEVKTEITSD